MPGSGDCGLSVLHEAYFYRDMAGFTEAARAFVEEGVAAGEVVLVAVSAPQIEALRQVLDPRAAVTFTDMARLGRNPGRIISVWRKFVRGNTLAGRVVRGIGEPVWAGRSTAELIECQRHEVLLNVAFVDGPQWRLMCPYNVTALDPEVLDEAQRSHPVVGSDGARTPSGHYEPDLGRLNPPLPPPSTPVRELVFSARNLREVRELVGEQADIAGLTKDQAGDFMLATHETAVNSVLHGGGLGSMRLWHEPGRLVCEFHDQGWIADPLVGRTAPAPGALHGRGLWLANELCDLVQLRSSADGTVVRMHVAAPVSQTW
jgi:anti-sigma regulatory factor (Ser/Thr protein kinase)